MLGDLDGVAHRDLTFAGMHPAGGGQLAAESEHPIDAVVEQGHHLVVHGNVLPSGVGRRGTTARKLLALPARRKRDLWTRPVNTTNRMRPVNTTSEHSQPDMISEHDRRTRPTARDQPDATNGRG